MRKFAFGAIFALFLTVITTLTSNQVANAAAPLPTTNGKVLSLATYTAANGDPWLVICGNFTRVAGQAASGVVTVNLRSGVLGVKGTFNSWVDTCIVKGSTIYAGGNFTSPRLKAAAINTSGSLTSWKPDTRGMRVYSLSADSSRIYAGTSNAVRAYTLTNGTDLWGTPSKDGAVRAVMVVPSHGRVYIGGKFSGFGGKTQQGLGAVRSDTGVPDFGWSPALKPNATPGGYDGENVLALAYDQPNERIVAGIGGYGTNALAAFNWLSPAGRVLQKNTQGDTQAVMVYAGYYFAGYHQSGNAPVNSNLPYIADAWTANGGDTTWGNGFGNIQLKDQAGPYGNDGRNGGINALLVNPATGYAIGGGAFTKPRISLSEIG